MFSFSHSVKVPRLYKLAAKLAKDVSEGKGSLKELVYTCKHPNLKALYALVAQVFQKTAQIEFLLKKSKLMEKESRFDSWLAKVLIVELLWGKKRLSGQSKPVQTILGYEQILKAHLSDEVQEERVELVDKPRYVRVNTLKISVADAIDNFRDEGWVLQRSSGLSYLNFLEKVSNLGVEEFMVDFHIPSLLVFPPKTQFYKHDAYLNGSIILQDKASCLPVHILNPPSSCTVLDMCAAPGMKTTQCAALMQNKGQIYAVEINKKRFVTLEKIIESAGATCIKSLNDDVLRLKDDVCPNTEYILVDPSCSGSGISDRLETGQETEPEARLERLAGFQIKILRHALTQFPQAKKIVYSTCSLFSEENEDVVRQVLETCTQFKLVPGQKFVGEEWVNFGSSDFGEIGKACLYTRPDVDLTNGFFVAVFERLEEGERNQFLNAKLFALQKKHQKELKRRERKEHSENLDKENTNLGLVETKKENKLESNEEVGKEDLEKNYEDEERVMDLDNSLLGKRKLVKTKKEKKNENYQEDKNINYEYQEEAINLDNSTIGKKRTKKQKAFDQNQVNSEEILDIVVEDKDFKRDNLKKNKKKKKEKFVETIDCETNITNQKAVIVDSEKMTSKKKKKTLFEDSEAFGSEKFKEDNQTNYENQEITIDIQDPKIGKHIKKRMKKHKVLEEVENVDLEINTDNLMLQETVAESESNKIKKKRETLVGCDELNNQNNIDDSETTVDQIITQEKKKRKKHKLIANRVETKDDNGVKKKKKCEKVESVILSGVKLNKQKCDNSLRMHAVEFF